MTKYLKVFIISFGFLFIICIVTIIISNKLYYPLYNKINNVDTIYTNIKDTNDITMQLITNKNIKEQIIVTTHPNLSLFYKFKNIPFISQILKKYI